MKKIELKIAENSDLPDIMTSLKENDLHTEDIFDKVGNLYIGYDSEYLVGIADIYFH